MPVDFDLDTIGVLEGADKSSSIEPRWDYLRHYEKIFEEFRNYEMNVIEIGVAKGASLNVWLNYFPRAHIIGVDISPFCANLAKGRVSIEIGSQDDPVFLETLCSKYPPTIVIDDGSHQADHIILTFERIFPRMLAGGIYIVEDLAFHFPPHFNFDVEGYSPPEYFSQIAKNCLARDSDIKAKSPIFEYISENVDSIKFVPSAVIIEKKGAKRRKYDIKSVRNYVKNSVNVNKVLTRYLAHMAHHKYPMEQIDELTRSIDRKLLDVEDYMNISNSQNDLGLWKKNDAEALILEGLGRFPNEFHLWWRLGHIKLVRGDYLGAVDSLKKAIANCSDGNLLVIIYDMLAQAFENLSMFGDATESLTASLAIAGNPQTREEIQGKLERLRALQQG